MPGQHGQAIHPAPDLPPKMHRTGSSRPAWAAALLAAGILMSVVWIGWEGRASSPERAGLVSPPPIPGPETETLGRISDGKAIDEGRCYCLAIPGPLKPRFEARLIRDGDLVTTVALTEGATDRLSGQMTVADGQATTAVLDLAGNDMQKGGESEVLVSLELEQRYARFVPGHFRGEFSLDTGEQAGTKWRYLVRWNTSEGGVLLLMEIEPEAAPDMETAPERESAVVLGRRLGSGQPKQ